MYLYIYIYMSVCLCVCRVPPPETYLFGTRPRVQAQKTFSISAPTPPTSVRSGYASFPCSLLLFQPTPTFRSFTLPSQVSCFSWSWRPVGWLVETCGDNKPRNWMIFEWGVAPWFVVRLPSKRVLNATLAMDGVRTPSADVMICISWWRWFFTNRCSPKGIVRSGDNRTEVSLVYKVYNPGCRCGSSVLHWRTIVLGSSDKWQPNITKS